MKLPKVDHEAYSLNPDRYELVSGNTAGAPNCPYGNKYQWIGFDKETKEFVRFTKSVFKKLVNAI